MKLFKKAFLQLSAIASLLFAGNASAASILQFTGNAQFDAGSLVAATEFSNFTSGAGNYNKLTVGVNSTGIFSALSASTEFNVGSPLIFREPTFIPTPLFSLGDYRFELASIDRLVLDEEGAYLILKGTGTIYGPQGFSTSASLRISTQGSFTPGNWASLSGSLVADADSITVPEGGSAIILFGLGLAGVETLRRRLSRQA